MNKLSVKVSARRARMRDWMVGSQINASASRHADVRGRDFSTLLKEPRQTTYGDMEQSTVRWLNEVGDAKMTWRKIRRPREPETSFGTPRDEDGCILSLSLMSNMTKVLALVSTQIKARSARTSISNC